MPIKAATEKIRRLCKKRNVSVQCKHKSPIRKGIKNRDYYKLFSIQKQVANLKCNHERVKVAS